MRLPHLKKKFIAGALAAGLVMGAGGIAAAYFTASGSGTASGSVGSSHAWTVHVTTPSGGALYPGQGLEQFTYSIQNGGGGNQRLNAVVPSVVVATNPGTCSPTTFIVKNTAPATGTYAPGQIGYGSVSVSLKTTTAPQTGCAGAVVHLTVTAS